MDLEKLIKENIKKEYQINESFNRIHLFESEDDKFNGMTKLFNHLISEGYSDDDLTGLVTEKWDLLKKIFNLTQDSDDTPKEKVMKTAGSGAVSQFTEYIISFVLKSIGLKGPMATTLSTFLSEMDFTSLVSLFKGQDGCIQHSSTLSKALMESMVTYIIETNTEKGSIVYHFFRNTFFEYLENSGYTKTIGDFMCKFFHKKTGSLLNF